ncbi:hypothetical protein HU200_012019 [Digitaria exilis]|uniref:Homeobox domain-containing protein n=1 Tax=Digitaria exilis TaxID=1010633 RepID=A0A835FFF1_9POAL|nr:hypothetical protein HU200_012019 [Digitaria exilis]
MDSHHGQAHHRSGEGEPTTAARSRWAPKPEQILILESIFNSGMVNPAKDETARIRRLLERFGSVRDANVFYWFQNRRSRSRRRARQLQQACTAAAAHLPASGVVTGAGGHYHDVVVNDNAAAPFGMNGGSYQQVRGSMMPTAAPLPSVGATAAPHFFSDEVDSGDDLFAISRQMGLMSRGGDRRCGSYMASDASQLSYQPTGTASIQVFINGAVYEVPGGSAPLDLAGTFGRDAMLVHSSGEILPVNEHGVLMKSLQMGECYYLV